MSAISDMSASGSRRPLDRSAPSLATPLLAQFSKEQQQRLTDLLDGYLRAQERGLPLAQETLLAANPDLADALRAYFHSLSELHDLAAGLSLASQPEQQVHAGNNPERLGDFELVREIGRGGMGVVYEARQLSLDRRVAVKVLPFAAILDSRQIARFKHEAQAAAQLHHPHIVPVFATGIERGVHYYAMQCIDGQSLDRAIAELRFEDRGTEHPLRRSARRGSGVGKWEEAVASNSRRPTSDTRAFALLTTRRGSDWRGLFRQVAELGAQAAEALAAAHEQGVIHRDIKPSNLLLETGGKLWVTDFGLARFQRDVALTRTGDLVGTLRYMSPEQAAGQAALVDHRTDIYSLGATLYELACLQPAFAAEEGPTLLQHIAHEEPRPPRQWRPEIPADLETVILKAMCKQRAGRYATARELADDLRCVAAGRPTRARPPGWAGCAFKWIRRQRRPLAACLCVVLLVAGGASASMLLIARERTHAASTAASADRRQSAAAAKHQALLRDMALSYVRLGAAHSQLREADSARDCYQRAIAVQEQLLDRSPYNRQVRHNLAVTWNNLGLLYSRSGRSQLAESSLRRSLELQLALVSQQSGEPRLYSDLGGTYCNLGIVLEKQGRLDLAKDALRQAIEHQQAAAAAPSPDAARFRDLLDRHAGHQARVLRAMAAAGAPHDQPQPTSREL